MNTTPTDLSRWETRGRWLAGATVAYNIVEGLVATGLGWAEESVALFGFGVDSFVEVGSALIVFWRLGRTDACGVLERERTASRWVAGLLAALGVGIALTAVARLGSGGAAQSPVPAMVVGLVSLLGMVFLWRAKLATARALDSRTLELDAACSRACIQLSAVLLAGGLLQAAVPALWWADGVAALGLAALVFREGREGWRAASRPDFSGGCGCH
jgi:divalent metal cation (Fe/Co/Zn/Cd) transporter